MPPSNLKPSFIFQTQNLYRQFSIDIIYPFGKFITDDWESMIFEKDLLFLGGGEDPHHNHKEKLKDKTILIDRLLQWCSLATIFNISDARFLS